MMKSGVSTSMKQCENKSLGNPGEIEVITLSSGDEIAQSFHLIKDLDQSNLCSICQKSHSYGTDECYQDRRTSNRNCPALDHGEQYHSRSTRHRSRSRSHKRRSLGKRPKKEMSRKSKERNYSNHSKSTSRSTYKIFHSRRNPRKASLSPVAENDYGSDECYQDRRTIDSIRKCPALDHGEQYHSRSTRHRSRSRSYKRSSLGKRPKKEMSRKSKERNYSNHSKSTSRSTYKIFHSRRNPRKASLSPVAEKDYGSDECYQDRRTIDSIRKCPALDHGEQYHSRSTRHRSRSRSYKRSSLGKRPKKEMSRKSKERNYSNHSKSTSRSTYKIFHSRRNPRKASLSPVAEKDYADTQVYSIYGRNVPSPITDFRQGNFKECIIETLQLLNYKEPTPIQAQGIPCILKGRDVIGIAQTGSGKTLTYILPAIVHVDQKCRYLKRNDGPIVLILAPTRELAQQIHSVCGNFTKKNNIKSICITGGEKKGPQLQDLDGADICIATPGRLIDFIKTKDVILKNSTTLLVLDEADRLFDMGFMPQIIKIVKELRLDHQTLMFSATWPTDVKQMAEDFLQDYIQINIGTLKLAANHNITQIVDVVEECEKDYKLTELLKKLKNKREKKIVFTNRRNRVEELTYHLNNDGYDAKGIHGKKSQKVRDQVLNEFRKGYFNILIATDVAARGLDVDDIKYVINVDFPNCSEDYIHRIGRTARLNKTGTAYTFFTMENINHAKFLVNVLQEANQTVNPKLLDLVEMPQSFNFRRGSPL